MHVEYVVDWWETINGIWRHPHLTALFQTCLNLPKLKDRLLSVESGPLTLRCYRNACSWRHTLKAGLQSLEPHGRSKCGYTQTRMCVGMYGFIPLENSQFYVFKHFPKKRWEKCVCVCVCVFVPELFLKPPGRFSVHVCLSGIVACPCLLGHWSVGKGCFEIPSRRPSVPLCACSPSADGC